MESSEHNLFSPERKDFLRLLLEYAGQETDESRKKILEDLSSRFRTIDAKLDNISALHGPFGIDECTHIYNREKITKILEEEIKRSTRYQIPLSLIMFAIDLFDIENHVLVRFVEIVSGMIRDTDVFARRGGEEFILLLPSTGEEDAFCLAERIRKQIEGTDFERIGTVTASFGVTEYVFTETVNECMKRLDDALYKAKNGGRNRVEVL
jgi:diguanylate cyclase (GGDEF)-like protein